MHLPKLTYVFEQDWLVNHCYNKNVLHLGCAGDSTLIGGKDACLHYKLSNISKTITGIEINTHALNVIKQFVPEKPGFIDYHIGNVERLDDLQLSSKYDVIVAGSIIEHLSNPGLMLQGIAKLLGPDGLLLISTPHTWGLIQYLRVAIKRVEAVNPEHTCWYSIPTLTELLSRFGLIPVEFATGYGWRPPSLSWKLQQLFGIPVFKILPHLGGSLLASYTLGEHSKIDVPNKSNTTK